MSVPMDPKDGSPPGSFVHGVSQARILDGLLFPSPGDLPNPEIKPTSPTLAGGFFTSEPQGRPGLSVGSCYFSATFNYISFYLFIYGCAGFLLLCRLSLVAASRGYSLVAVRGLLIAVASLIAEHGLYSVQASVVAAHGLSSCGSWAPKHRLNSVAPGLSCPTACGVFPDQGSNPCLLH